MKRFISTILALTMFFSILPVGEIAAFAQSDRATIDKIIVNKTYESIDDYGSFFITLTGDNLDRAEIKIMEAGGELQDPEKVGASGRYTAQYKYPASEVGQRLFIDGKTYTLGEEDMPRITGRDGATSKIINTGQDVTLTGENIYNLYENKDNEGKARDKIKGYFSQSGSKNYIKNNELVDENENPIVDRAENVKIKKNIGTVTGGHSLIFEKETKDNDVPIEIEHTYKSIVIVRGDLIVKGRTSIFPSQGPTDTLVTITAKKLEENVSVFLMPKGQEHRFTKENMADNDTVRFTQEDDKEQIRFRVPRALKNGQHEIVLTNRVDPGKNIDEQISKERLIGNNVNAEGEYEEDEKKVDRFESLDFNIVDGRSGVDLNKISPNYSSIKGIPARIEGRNMIRISPNLYEKGDDTGLDEENIDISNKEMVVEFIGGKYDGREVEKIKRTITVQIGVNASFTGHDITGSVYDYLDIIVPENDDLDKPVKDVIVFITNEIVFENKDKATITERDVIENGFTYKPIDYEPEIKEIIPNTIPVDSNGKVTDDFIISISGQNFLKYGYVDNKELKTKTPRISVDKQGTSFRWFDNENIKMYDQAGNLLNEKEGEQFASLIKIKINKGSEIPDTIIGSTQNLKLQNPLAVESKGEMGSSALTDITFVKVDADDTPIITDVSPEIITTGGANGIVITGTNFREDVSIILDGQIINGFERNGVGTELIFDAPAKPEGIYQIIVQNGNGGAATFDNFEYLETRTSPKLNDFSPKEGTRNTLVTIKGENFLTTDPLVKNISSAGIYRLIGTRVKLGGVDVNEYNRDSEGQILLKDFASNEKILKIEDDLIEPASYIDDVVLVDDKGGSPNDEYFKIYKDFRTAKLILTDGRKNYEIYSKSGKIYVDFENREIEIDLSTSGELKLEKAIEKEDGTREDLSLNIRTPYSIGNKIIRYKQVEEDGLVKYERDELGAYVKDTKASDPAKKYIKIAEIDDIENKRNDLQTEQGITGSNVKVLNNDNPSRSELTFIVPEKMKEGFYDVSIVNPDTKSDSKVGKNGFYYYLQPQRPISISHISPDKGSTEGGYYINIGGTNFRDNGDGDKAMVIIGGERVDPKDIEVSPDGTNLRVRVPEYPGDLDAETDTGRRTVPVVVVNPDGASDNVQQGFTYIVPKSNPHIKQLVLDKGSASGGQIVNIIGSDFRFYEPYIDINGNGKWDDKGEADTDGDGLITDKDPAEPFDDLNGDGTWTDLTNVDMEDLVNNDERQDSKILPTVYMGNKEAEIVSFREGQIDIKVPQGQEGSVDVYIVNNDYGTSNRVKYTYKTSSPQIDSIVPNVGRKQGNDKVEILGSNFHNTKIKYIKKTDDGKIDDGIKNMPLVRFASLADKTMSNRDISLGQQYSGQIIGGRSEVKVGDLTVEYLSKKTGTELTFTLKKGQEDEKEIVYGSYDNKEICFPISLLDSSLSECVKISLEQTGGVDNSRRLRVDRGFALETELLNSGHISLRTPSYYTIGKTKLTIINPDGGKAEGDFEYKNPDSSPVITNILRDTQEGRLEEYIENGQEKTRKIVRVNIDGGNTIDILGKDFRKPVKIKIGDLPEITTGIEYDPSNEAISNKMTFTMPSVDDSYINQIHRVVIENEDGGTAGSDGASPPVYIQFIKGETTGLQITDIDPKAGTSKGGTEVTIKGKDFRKTMEGFEGEELKVYFDKGSDQIRVPNSDIISVSIDKIVLRTPKHKPGTVSIKVENPDGSIAEKDNAFTYISNPKINNIFKIDSEGKKRKAESLYIDGGEDLVIEGTEFMEGARVIFNPILKESSKNPDANGESVFIEDSKGKTIEYILESGTPGTDVKLIDSGNIKVKTPSGQLDSGGVIVINPDNAATGKYPIKYTIEDIDHPQSVHASLIQDEYIRINWDEVTDKATELDGKTVQYEVYAIEGNSRHLIGSTGTTGFVFRDIKPNTTYKFLVRAVGKYGSSKPINESMSNPVTTGSKSGPKDEDGKPGEQTTVNKTGDTANVVIGEDAFSSGNEYVIDLTRGTLAGSDKAVVSISAKVVVKEKYKQIKVVGKDFSLNFTPNVFETATITSNKDNANAGVKFEVSPVNKNFELSGTSNHTILSSKYDLRARVFVGSSSNEVENLNGKMNLILDYDANMADVRRLKNINLVKYDIYDKKFKDIFGNRSSYGTSIGDINELGTYMITGSRR